MENQIWAKFPVIEAAYENQATRSKTKIIGVLYAPESSTVQKLSPIQPLETPVHQCWPGPAASSYLVKALAARILIGSF